jgi:spermidine synthase
MMTPDPSQSPVIPASRGHLPLLLVLFVGSGCSALIYEIVWFQLLQFVIGSSAVSLGVLLGTFMGGLCLGSVGLPRVIPARRHALRVYAFLEIGIGVAGLLILFGMPEVDRLYAAAAGTGFRGMLLRGAVCAVCLLPPTLLMGATLPAVARWLETTPRGVAWLGLFYGGNIAGAVLGCLLAGFYLLRVYDVETATYVAAAINGAAALTGLGLAALTPYAGASRGTGFLSCQDPTGLESCPTGRPAPGAWSVYVAIALSGLCALGAEVIWTRLLSLMLGATVYTFSIVLAVFLASLGLGSAAGSLLARGVARPRLALGYCQLLLTAAVAWAAFMLARSLPYWPISPSLSPGPWFDFQLDLLRCQWAVLPAAVLWGASFPLALAAAATPGQDPGRLAGGISAANTAGAIAGAVTFSLCLIPGAGTQASQRVLVGLSGAAALLLFASLLRPRGLARRLAGGAALAAAAGVAAVLAWTVPPVPAELIAWGRQLPKQNGTAEILYAGEGMNASVAVSQQGEQHRSFHVSGKVEASTLPGDMRVQRMLGHLPALVHPRPRSVLVVGCGAGVTAGTFVVHPEVERIVLCEIEPLIPQVVAGYFTPQNHDVLHDPRLAIVYDDARHHVLTTPERFDVITSDPIHPWVKGAATLYTQEYFELCKRHLNPGGLVTQWVPLYESDTDTVRSEIATFFKAFPDGSVWANWPNGEGSDLVLLGHAGPTRIDLDDCEQRLKRDDHAAVAQSLREVGFGGALELFATYGGRASDLQGWLKEAEINRDGNLRLQYLAGMGVNTHLSGWIYRQMLSQRRFPDDLFTGSAGRKQALRRLLEARHALH